MFKSKIFKTRQKSLKIFGHTVLSHLDDLKI